MATCPECDAEIEIDADDLEEMEIGDPWDCEACGSTLRVANLDPLDFETDDEDEDDEEPKIGAEEAEAPDGVEDDVDEDEEEEEDTEGWDK